MQRTFDQLNQLKKLGTDQRSTGTVRAFPLISKNYVPGFKKNSRGNVPEKVPGFVIPVDLWCYFSASNKFMTRDGSAINPNLNFTLMSQIDVF